MSFLRMASLPSMLAFAVEEAQARKGSLRLHERVTGTVMAAQFERFLDPPVVMFSVPAALVGVIPTLLLTGTTLNVRSVMGLVMLIGIVVNNAIVLLDCINLRRREAGMGVLPATVEAARLCLRPILMTTATTVLGMFPLALGLVL
jgi:HAE1 family hydrophobic/amphiphilic exporter-1